jgi:hypothetical protein
MITAQFIFLLLSLLTLQRTFGGFIWARNLLSSWATISSSKSTPPWSLLPLHLPRVRISGLFRFNIYSETMNPYAFGRIHWMGDRPTARPLPTHDNTPQTCMPQAGFEPTIPMFERCNIAHLLDPKLLNMTYRVSVYLTTVLLLNSLHCMRLEVSTAVSFKITVFWDVSPCRLTNTAGSSVGKGRPETSGWAWLVWFECTLKIEAAGTLVTIVQIYQTTRRHIQQDRNIRLHCVHSHKLTIK